MLCVYTVCTVVLWLVPSRSYSGWYHSTLAGTETFWLVAVSNAGRHATTPATYGY